LSEPEAGRSGRSGMKPVHGVVAAVLALLWAGVLAFVLTHGHDDPSSADVSSQLPPGFSAGLKTHGVTYAGLSPVDGATVRQVLSTASTDASARPGTAPIVLRTSFTDHAHDADYADRPALMVVIPDPRYSRATAGRGDSAPVYVAFVDPQSFQVLTSVTYDAAPAAG
jgi:hypothetical protein